MSKNGGKDLTAYIEGHFSSGGLPVLVNDEIGLEDSFGLMSGTAAATVLAAMLAGSRPPAPGLGGLLLIPSGACLLVIADTFTSFALLPNLRLHTEWYELVRFTALSFIPGLVAHSLVPPAIIVACRGLLRASEVGSRVRVIA